MDMGAFKKVDIVPQETRRGGKPTVPTVSVYKKHNYLAPSVIAIEQAGFRDGDRLDLYRMGRTFALKRETAGLLTLKEYINRDRNGKLTKTQYRISNASACLEIRSATRLGDEESKQRRSYRFKAWVEEGVLFFRTDEEV